MNDWMSPAWLWIVASSTYLSIYLLLVVMDEVEIELSGTSILETCVIQEVAR